MNGTIRAAQAAGSASASLAGPGTIEAGTPAASAAPSAEALAYDHRRPTLAPTIMGPAASRTHAGLS